MKRFQALKVVFFAEKLKVEKMHCDPSNQDDTSDKSEKWNKKGQDSLADLASKLETAVEKTEIEISTISKQSVSEEERRN